MNASLGRIKDEVEPDIQNNNILTQACFLVENF